MTQDRSNDGAQPTGELLRQALEHLNQAVSIFDADLKLVACNRRYLELLDFPAWMGRAGTPIQTFFRYNAERGEYGEGEIEALVRERVELASQFVPHRFERTRLDGTVLEIEGNPLPGGGFVTTYTDITERKRVEQVLRDSRDELERRVQERTSELRRREQELAEESRLLGITLEHMSQGITMFDADLKLAVCNQRFLDLTEMPQSYGERGTPFETFMRHNAERGEYGAGDPEALTQERVELARQFQPHAFQRQRPDGTVLEVVGRPLPGGGLVTTYTDITDRHQLEHQRQLSQRLREILDRSPVGVAIWPEDDQRLTYLNQRLLALLGIPPDDAPETELQSYCVDPEQWHQLLARFRERGEIRDAEMALMRSDGSQFWALTTLEALSYEGRPSVLAWVYDFTAQHQARERLHHLAHHDPLTQLPNRRMLDAHLTDAVSRAAQSRSSGAVLYLDLDGFKALNDLHGHEFGDFVLQAAAQRIKSSLREGDFAARLGGDEFVVVLENTPAEADATAAAQRLVRLFDEPFHFQGETGRVSASVGVSRFGSEQPDPEAIIREADRDMYRSKGSVETERPQQ